MLPPKIRRNIVRIIPFGLFWLFFSTIYLVLERGLLGNLSYYPSTGNPYSFGSNILVTPLAALVSGLFIGTIEIIYFNKLFIEKSFTQKIIYKSVIYLLIILFFLAALTVIANCAELKTGFSDT